MPQVEYLPDNLVKLSTEHFFMLYAIYQAYIADEKKKAYRRTYYDLKRRPRLPFTVDRSKITVNF